MLHQKLPLEERKKIIELAQEATTKAIELFKDPGWNNRRGGYLCVADLFGAPLMVILIGDVSREKVEKYPLLAMEKARRVARSFEDSGHVSSFENRDPEARIPGQPESDPPWGRWGGAVRGRSFILSFSGLPELGDEAVVLAIWAGLDHENTIDCEDIARNNKNPYFAPLVAALGW